MHRRSICMWHKATAAAGFVHAFAPDGDPLFGFKSALRIVGGLAALHADSMSLSDVLGNREQLRHWLTGLAGVILIEAGDDHTQAAAGELVDDLYQLVDRKRVVEGQGGEI